MLTVNGIKDLDWITRKDSDIHFNPKVYGYDLQLTPHALSEQLFLDQAEFIAASMVEVLAWAPIRTGDGTGGNPLV